MSIQTNYEVSSEGAVRHWEITASRMTNTTPLPTEAAEVTSLLPGTQLVGTVLTVDPPPGSTVLSAIVDFTHSAVYRHPVRNVRTYNGGAENTFGVINEGDAVYYDNSATMPANTFLSTSPLDRLGAANTLFGFAVGADDADRALFPKGAAGATTVTNVAIMQRGA